jgi:hypothetical protein
MSVQDLELAKLELRQKALSLVVTKGGKTIFETSLPGVKGFIQCINECGKELNEASVADRVVGKPIALLCVYSGVVHVFAALISMGAMKVLDNASIPFQFENAVPRILDSSRIDLCPMEKLVQNIDSPSEAWEILKSH